MDNKTAFTAYLLHRQDEKVEKDYKAYLSMTINSYHTKKGGRYPRKVYGYL